MDSKTVSQYEYLVHPNAALFPELSGDEYQKLKADIEAHGQQEPIMLDEAGEILLDGRTRLRICKELGKTPRIERFAATPAYSESDFIWSINVMRRHLDADQRAMLSQRWADGMKDAAKLRQKAHGGTAPGLPKNTSGENAISVTARKETAKKAGVTEHKVRQAETVAKHAPELTSQVERGEVSLKDAAATAAKKAKRPRTIRTSGPLEIERRAAGWLANVLAKFEERGYAQADAEQILSKLTASEKEIFLRFSEWLSPIRLDLYTASKPEHAETEAAQPIA